MFVNYLKTAWRNLVRHKGYAFINIFGLALGLALAILIALYVEVELSFDRFHTNYSRIHRVEVNYDNKERFLAFSQTPIGPALVVLGVVKDYHYASLRFGIEPMLLFPMPHTPQASRAYNMLSVKLSGVNNKKTVQAIQEKY